LGLPVRFTIEVYNSDGEETVLHRVSLTAISPFNARRRAVQLLAEWSKRNASGVRVLNGIGERIYDWRG
jgi:hypothetical protein